LGEFLESQTVKNLKTGRSSETLSI
jgi:hypothetical protein